MRRRKKKRKPLTESQRERRTALIRQLEKQRHLFGEPDKPKAAGGLQPRDYQGRAVHLAMEHFDAGESGVLVRLATGMGKTITAAIAIQQWLDAGPLRRAVILCHERQLVGQWRREMQQHVRGTVGIEMAGDRVDPTDLPHVTIASRQTLLERVKGGQKVTRLAKFSRKCEWLVVVDEAHRYARKLTSCRHIFDHFSSAKLGKRLGLTATPERGDGVSIASLFPVVAADIRMMGEGDSATNLGWAVPFDQRFIQVEGVDFANLREVSGDFDKTELAAVLTEQETLASLCQPMLDLVGDRRNLIFCPTVAAAETVARWINAKAGGEIAKSVSGKAKEDTRRAIFGGHQGGEFQHLAVCGLCREGYDDPGLAAITIFRPTKSRPLAEQMKGRGCRPIRSIVPSLNAAADAWQRRALIALSDKPNCMVIDMVGVSGMADCATTAAIYAEGKPDEVIERANEKMVDGEQDVEKAVADAEREIEQEKAAERREREAAEERRKQREMDRRARLEAKVRYKARKVRAGHGGKVAKPKGAARTFPFGKYAGRLYSEIPAGYLRWASANLEGNVQRSCSRELFRREELQRLESVREFLKGVKS